MKETGIIYKITSPSGKIYVGSTKDFKQRMRHYERAHCKAQVRLYNSIIKYGFENHVVEILDEVLIEYIYKAEAVWGNYYDVLGRRGLNCTLPKTSDRYKNVSDETRIRMSNSRKNKPNPLKGKRRGGKLTEDMKKHLSEKLKEYYKNNEHHAKGVKMPKEVKEKISKTLTGIKRSDDFKKDISERNKGEKSYWYNKEMSCEHKQNMRKGHINSEKSRNLTILDEVTGVYYESLGEACELLNLKKETLRSWLTHSKHTNKTNLVLC